MHVQVHALERSYAAARTELEACTRAAEAERAALQQQVLLRTCCLYCNLIYSADMHARLPVPNHARRRPMCSCFGMLARAGSGQNRRIT